MGPGGVQVRNLEMVAKQGLLDAIPEDDVKRIRNLVCLDPHKPAPHAPVGVEEIGRGPAIGIAAEGCLELWREPGQEHAAPARLHLDHPPLAPTGGRPARMPDWRARTSPREPGS